MITVRFPDGTAVQYNTATRVKYKDTVMELCRVDGEREHTIACVGYNCIVELAPASSVHNPVKNPASALRFVTERLRDLSVYDVARLKAMLKDFDATKKMWK